MSAHPTINEQLRRSGSNRRDLITLCGKLMVAAPFGLAITNFVSHDGRPRHRGTRRSPRHAAGTVGYYLGIKKTKPQFARFSYAEKTEYWAGMWGMVVMALTGLMIWYAVAVATWIPRWWIDVATTVHYYEAILATLAILVWHFYHVIFDPDVYPMSWAWFDGKMPEEQYKEEHPLADDVPHEEAGEPEEK